MAIPMFPDGSKADHRIEARPCVYFCSACIKCNRSITVLSRTEDIAKPKLLAATRED